MGTLDMVCTMLDSWRDRASDDTSREPFSLVQPEDVATAQRQRDQALLLNPWTVGQQLLLSTFTSGTECGCMLIDSLGQLRLAIHLYNALRVFY